MPEQCLCMECGYDGPATLLEHLQDIERSRQALRERLRLATGEPPTVHAISEGDTVYLVDPVTLAELRGAVDLLAGLTTVGAVKAFDERIPIGAVLPRALLAVADERGGDIDAFIDALPDDTPVDEFHLQEQMREHEAFIPVRPGSYFAYSDAYDWLPEMLEELAEHADAGFLGGEINFIEWHGRTGRWAIHVLDAHGFRVVEE
ncbi:MAG: hypothetical protein M3467_12710 [Actinomycetota bacterium]|nr:hypothetical protein [Euzebyaceae bacterium]MDQ3433048.1 hypothetical protein [Actinomycetota bacterium]